MVKHIMSTEADLVYDLHITHHRAIQLSLCMLPFI